jgi:hypothetical protein
VTCIDEVLEAISTPNSSCIEAAYLILGPTGQLLTFEEYFAGLLSSEKFPGVLKLSSCLFRRLPHVLYFTETLFGMYHDDGRGLGEKLRRLVRGLHSPLKVHQRGVCESISRSLRK